MNKINQEFEVDASVYEWKEYFLLPTAHLYAIPEKKKINTLPKGCGRDARCLRYK